MLSLSVHATSLHAGRPIPPQQGTTSTTTDFPPPSTVKGFLESLAGKERGWFNGRIAVGLLKDPAGRGTSLKKGTYWSNQEGPVGPNGEKGKPLTHQTTGRTVNWDFLIDVGYRVVVDTTPEHEAQLRQSLRGETDRFGILSLGTSEDEVYMLEEKEVPARWIVEGSQYPLTVTTGDGFDTRTPSYKTFDVQEEPQVEVPLKAWVVYEAPTEPVASTSVPKKAKVKK